MRKLLMMLMLVMMITTVVAAPPFESGSNEGMDFAPATTDVFKAGEDYKLHLHVINATEVQTDATTSCMFHLYDDTGAHIVEKPLIWDSNLVEFKLDIDGANLTIGHHAYVAWCNNTGKQIHLVKGTVEVTGTGYEFTEARSIFYSAIMAILAFLFVVCILGFNALPNENPKDLDGKLLDINWLKYLRYPVGVLAWGMLTMMFYIGWNISEVYLSTTLAAKIFEVLYTISFSALMIVVPILLIYIIVRAIEDAKFKRYIERGLM